MKRISELGVALVAGVLLSACAGAGRGDGKPTPMETAQAGKALYEEKCRTVAGEKIYRTVAEVEGVLLMKVRPAKGGMNFADPIWPGAAFAREAYLDEYVETFLGYEFGARDAEGFSRPITRDVRGFIGANPSEGSNARPGYRWVDVIDPKDGVRYRYSLVRKLRPTSKIGWIDTLLERSPAPEPAPRYAVTYEDHVNPEERALGVASSTVKVIDLETREVLGEMLRYAWGIFPASGGNPSPWLRARQCPDHAYGYSAATRKFADQILIPRKEQ